jgi:hypothetical protein
MSSDRKEIKKQYGKLFDAISAALFEADAIGINIGDNTDEYDPEAGTIIPRLKTAKSAEDVEIIINEEFIKWFGQEYSSSNNEYKLVSEKIWLIWSEFNETETRN